MRQPKTLPAFTTEEFVRAKRLLAARVAYMMGRKFEEGDWAHVYCNAKNIPQSGWSNLNIDIMYNGLGVEHKMLKRSNKSIKDLCGNRLMHPAATRSIRIPSLELPPDNVMRDVLNQYAELIAERREKVRESCPAAEPDMRTGWLLWQNSLEEFLYFEEEMVPPDPNEYFAEWHESSSHSRKGSRNLWVYEKATGQKRYSITTSAGAKIQPYFDIPPPNDSNLYFFRVQGEALDNGLVRIWITASTARELQQILGDLSSEKISDAILQTAVGAKGMLKESNGQFEVAVSLQITSHAYKLLAEVFPGVSDEHMLQHLVQHLTNLQA